MAESLFSNLKEIINIQSTKFKWDENPYYNMELGSKTAVFKFFRGDQSIVVFQDF